MTHDRHFARLARGRAGASSRGCGVGLGRIALAGLLAAGSSGRGERRRIRCARSRRARRTRPARAKRVIQLFMAGGPSHLDLFDHKPELARLEGKPLPPSVIAGQRYAFIRPDAAVLGPRFPFARHGQCGAELSDQPAAPRRGRRRPVHHHARCAPTSSTTTPAQLLLNTGFSQPGRPSLGSWALYGLGARDRRTCPASW